MGEPGSGENYFAPSPYRTITASLHLGARGIR